jgi:hypothetical protein
MAVRFVSLGSILLAFQLLAHGQSSHPVVPLQLSGEPRATEVPNGIALGAPQCDSSGDISLRYASASGNVYAPGVAQVAPDASTQLIALSPLPDATASHTFIFAAGDDASLYEILRASASGAQSESNQVQYVRFDNDGALRSNATFADEFVPSMLVPLPSGDFFAAGVTLQRGDESVKENSLAGIFDPDARLLRRLRSDPHTEVIVGGKKQAKHDNADVDITGGTARLGDDGSIYILPSGEHATIAVANQAGRITRRMTLWEPFETSVASDMWVSGNRLLVTYEGEADDPKDSFVYVLYDAQTGEVIRAYRPEFSGILACFQDGQTLSVLVRQQASGKLAVATAELE